MKEGGANESPKAATAEPKPGPGPTKEPPEPQKKPKEEEHGAAAAAKMVKVVKNLEEFRTELENAGGKLVVIDFSATWCGPCKMIKPFYHSLCEKYPDVCFMEVDVDDAQDVASDCDVKCMPTFQFYKNNQKVHEFSGANKDKLEETIKQLK